MEVLLTGRVAGFRTVVEQLRVHRGAATLQVAL